MSQVHLRTRAWGNDTICGQPGEIASHSGPRVSCDACMMGLAVRWQREAAGWHESAMAAREAWDVRSSNWGAVMDYASYAQHRARAFQNQFAWRFGSLDALDAT